MDEFSFINLIRPHTYRQSTVVKGIGDDAAVFRQSVDDVVTAVDVFVEGVHFSRSTMTPYHVGYRALAANLSDLAAMGANPVFYLVSIVVPNHWDDMELEQIFNGMKDLANVYQIDLIGGDTVSGKELVLSITVIGYVHRTKARLRSDAREGDAVFVTGTLGDSRAGLYMLTHQGDYHDKAYFINRHQMPSPRVRFAKELSGLTRVALNDISDGIANEASEIAEASRVTVNLNKNKLPTHPSLTQFSMELQQQWTYFGGEDFELIGTVAERDWTKVLEAARKTNTPVKKVGYVSQSVGETGHVYLHEKNKKILLKKLGYTHLK